MKYIHSKKYDYLNIFFESKEYWRKQNKSKNTFDLLKMFIFKFILKLHSNNCSGSQLAISPRIGIDEF